jgi:pimeloyl-ACP methyl ester carboxylesterase
MISATVGHPGNRRHGVSCQAVKMTTYVLVHGAWGGSHGWIATRRALQNAGHEVFTPCLTGLGERVHLSGPMVGLDTHIHDVVNHVMYEDLGPIVLVGHSYGGMVIAGAVRHIRDRISDLVFVDAFVPADGQSVRSLGGPVIQDAPDRIELAAPWAIADRTRDLEDVELAAWLNARRTAQPIRTFTETVRMDQPLADEAFRLVYVKAAAVPRPEDPAGFSFWTPADVARTSPRWGYAEIATDHMVPQNRPEKLAALLQDLPVN